MLYRYGLLRAASVLRAALQSSSLIELPEACARAGQDEVFRILDRKYDAAAHLLLFRVPTHELCDGFVGPAAGFLQLGQDVGVAARADAAITEAKAMHLI